MSMKFDNQSQAINSKQEEHIFKVRDVLVWIILPFLIGCIILYFAARYLIRNLRAYSTQFVK